MRSAVVPQHHFHGIYFYAVSLGQGASTGRAHGDALGLFGAGNVAIKGCLIRLSTSGLDVGAPKLAECGTE